MTTAETTSRRRTLRKLLADGRGGTQEELRALLRERGFETTQSTISRDLKLLGAERNTSPDGTIVYRLVASSSPRFPTDMVLAVEYNESLILLRTKVGRAPAVALELDALRHPDILGTIAGDDTVLVIPRTSAAISRLNTHLLSLAHLRD